MSHTARRVGDKVIPERAGYYLGLKMVEQFVAKNGIADSLRTDAVKITAHLEEFEVGAGGGGEDGERGDEERLVTNY